MKSSIIIPVQDPTPFSALTIEAGFESNLEKAAGAGYDGVELAITNPVGIDAETVKELLELHGLALSAITTGQAYGLEGISLSSPEENLRQKALERIKDHAHLAGALDSNAVIIIGSMRGDGTNKDARFLLRDALREIAGEYPATKFALEPLNRYESVLINTVEEALELLAEINLSNIGLLFDTFHANIEERSFAESIQLAGEKIFHVHVADSNRFIPGHGHLDFAQVGASLRDIDYQGFCCLESLPRPSPDKCLDYAADFIRKL